QRALAGIRENGTASAAQRFYQRGLRLCQQGNGAAARLLWENIVRAFHGVESERRWVDLAQRGLRALATQSAPSKYLDDSIQEALGLARQLRDQGKRPEAEEIWKGLEALYRGDPFGEEVLREIQRDRGS